MSLAYVSQYRGTLMLDDGRLRVSVSVLADWSEGDGRDEKKNNPVMLFLRCNPQVGSANQILELKKIS